MEDRSLRSLEWKGGKCRVPMFMMGSPAGFCDKPAFGPQYPKAATARRYDQNYHMPYCLGPCCPGHGGPAEGEPILFEDGTTPKGYPMWCAVMPDFENLQESPAGFSGDPLKAITNLREAIAAQPQANEVSGTYNSTPHKESGI
jgi:hypothetical protein